MSSLLDRAIHGSSLPVFGCFGSQQLQLAHPTLRQHRLALLRSWCDLVPLLIIQLPQLLIDLNAPHPAQHLHRRPHSILPPSVRPVWCRVEELDEGGMPLLDLLQGGCLLKGGIGQP
jgi:hypothetical protein